MIRREIKIELEFEDADAHADERYADTANAIWMLMKAIAEPDRFNFFVDHDGSRAGREVGDDLNARWDEYGKEARWG